MADPTCAPDSEVAVAEASDTSLSSRRRHRRKPTGADDAPGGQVEKTPRAGRSTPAHGVGKGAPNKRGEKKKRKKNQATRSTVERTVRGAAVVVYLAIVVLCFTVSWAPRLFWTMALPLIPIGFVIAGFHPWRKVCPLAFWGDLGRRLKRGEQRKVGKWLESWFYVVTLAFLGTMLVVRHVAINGDGLWLGGALIALGVAAAGVNLTFTGKTWCNFVCPVGMVERIYTEPNSLPDRATNSQCIKCTACKKNCPDIDQENSYWKEVDSAPRRFAFYAFPGLVTAFYTYYYLRYGNWESYFGGGWTRQPATLDLLVGDGFFFAPAVPAVVAAVLTHAGFAVASFGLFALLEKHVAARFIESEERRRHIMLTVAAFTAFNLFYLWAGAPSLRLLPGGVRVVAFAIPVVATLFLIKRSKRTRERYLQEKSVSRMLKKWTFDEPPPSDPGEVVAWFKAHDDARETQLAAYKEAVSDVLSDGIVTADEHRLLEHIRIQLGISEKEHKKIMARLSDEQRNLFEPGQVMTIERRLQLEGYRVALSLALMRGASERELEAQRLEYGVDLDEHRRVLDALRGESSPLVGRAEALLDEIDALRETLATIGKMDTVVSFDFLVFALLKQQDRLVDRVVDILASLADDEDAVHAVEPELFVHDKSRRQAALERLEALSDSRLVTRLGPVVLNRRPPADPGRLGQMGDALAALIESPDRYVRAGSIFALGELQLESLAGRLVAALDDPDALVRETAVHAVLRAPDTIERARLERLRDDDPAEQVRRAAAEALAALDGETPRVSLDKQLVTTGRSAAPPMPDAAFSLLSGIERILFLRCVPLLAEFDPDELDDLSRLTREATVEPGGVVCEQGDESEELYVVISGQAQVLVSRTARGNDDVVATIAAGGHFGELAALDGSPRSATVQASEDEALRLLVIDAAVFRNRLLVRPDVAVKLMTTMATRLRETLASAAT